MANNKIDAVLLSKMFLSGAKALESKKELINELNVFPVPDGDTGTNMTLTIMSAAREVASLGNDPDMKSLSKAISSGSLRGARGNSGVILSQLLRGMTKVVRDVDEIDAPTLANSFRKATETAYKAVMKPKEGTILTVAKGAADKAAELVESTDDMGYILSEVIKHAEFVLSKTPEMLPVLKEAGVVDSGGQGLLEALKGAYDCFMGKEIDFCLEDDKEAEKKAEELKYSYSCEFEISLSSVFNSKNDQDLKTYFDSLGEIKEYLSGEDRIRLSLDLNDPGSALSKAIGYGQLHSVKIVNLKDDDNAGQDSLIAPINSGENNESEGLKAKEASEESLAYAEVDDDVDQEAGKKPVFSESAKEMGFIAVSAGEGMNSIFRGLGVDHIIPGGQTMNPSTDDMVSAINHVNAKTVFILPNNKNIILAANQAQYLVDDKKVIVIPTKTIPQGISALINYMPDDTVEVNEANMLEAIGRVKTGQITYAVRDTVINNIEIKQGNIMGIGDHEILAVGTIVENTAVEMLSKMVDDDTEVISLYYGEEVDDDVANDLASQIESIYPDVDVECHQGGQPIYYYIISVE